MGYPSRDATPRHVLAILLQSLLSETDPTTLQRVCLNAAACTSCHEAHKETVLAQVVGQADQGICIGNASDDQWGHAPDMYNHNTHTCAYCTYSIGVLYTYTQYLQNWL